MDEAIIFPHLGIVLKQVGQSIDVYGFQIAYYGMIIGCAILIGIWIATMEAKHTGQNPEIYMDLAIFAVVFGIIGARAYYVIFSWDMYKGNLLSIFNTRQGGLAIYGGVIAAVITVVVFAKIKKYSIGKLLDTAVLGLVTGQMIGRWGNFFNREAFGDYTDGLFAMKLPINAVRVSDITDQMRAHIEVVDGTRFIQVHPTFFYESVWCLIVLIILLYFRGKKLFEGQVFLMYLVGYGAGRFFIEQLRTDQLLLPKIKLPVSELLALGLVVVGTIVLTIKIRMILKKERAKLQIRKKPSEESIQPQSDIDGGFDTLEDGEEE